MPHAAAAADARPVHGADQGLGLGAHRAEAQADDVAGHALAPSASTDLLREGCPDGPSTGLTWDDDESPSLGDVTTLTSQTRFLKARSFTVRGTKSWHASVQPPTGAYTWRSGEKQATWSWEVTFTMKKQARR
jgi:hypothetical protein